MTERLYYTDSTRTRFSGRVVERLTWEGKPALVLNRTAFYPASGGQPADRGTLEEVAVLDVVERDEDGAVVHVLEQPLPRDSTVVEGVIDWERRFDHMQQHSGQHILSAAFEKLLDADTVGFHLGAEISTVDINVARLEPAQAIPVEELANRVVWENRRVNVRTLEPEEAASLPLRRRRRLPTVEGPLRIVEIAAPPHAGSEVATPPSEESFDLNPCGGTHVTRTGEVGLIKIVRLDYRGDETRVEFLCGGRALRDYRAKNDMAYQLASMLTVGHWELDQAVERLQTEAKQLRQKLRRAGKRLLKVDAEELVKSALVHQPASESAGEPRRVVWKVWQQSADSVAKSPQELRALALEAAQFPGVVALLSSIEEDEGRTHLCFARAEEVNLDVAALLREACQRLGGKGGGQPHLAQGSAPATDVSRVESVLADLLSSLGLPA